MLEEAATLAAELAVEIGEPVSPALTNVRVTSSASTPDRSLEAASDLDEQLANLQGLVDDAAAGVITPTEEVAASAEDTSLSPASVAVTPETSTVDTLSEAVPEAAGSPVVDVGVVMGGVIGNMPKKQELKPPPPPPAKDATAGKTSETSTAVPIGERFRRGFFATVFSAGGVCVRFLELIDEPFEFIGKRPRMAIGWFAIATVGASAIVAILSVLL